MELHTRVLPPEVLMAEFPKLLRTADAVSVVVYSSGLDSCNSAEEAVSGFLECHDRKREEIP